MRILQHLGKSRSSSLASQPPLLLRVAPHGLFFLAFPQPLPFWLPIPLLLLSLAGSTSSSKRLSLLRSGLSLQQARCAIRGHCQQERAGLRAPTAKRVCC